MGGKKKAYIKLHYVRWVVGSKNLRYYDTSRKDWFGSSKRLHIESYKKIKYLDGYKINLRNVENLKINNNKFSNKSNTKKNLCYVNIGSYDPSSMLEKYEFGLVIATNKLVAKNRAESQWLIGLKKSIRMILLLYKR